MKGAQEAAPKPKWIGAKPRNEKVSHVLWYQARRCTSPAYIRVSRICSSCPAPAHGLPPRSTGQWLAALVLLRSTPVQPPVPFTDQFVLSPSPSGLSVFSPRTMLHFTSLVCSFLRSFVLLLSRAPRRGLSETSMRDSSSFLISLSHSLSLFLSISVSFHPSVPAPTASGHPRAPLFSAARPFLVPNPARFHG